MKQILVAGIIWSLTLSAFAQQDNRAKEILDEVSKKTRSCKTIAADFTFSMENKEMDIYEKNDGSIYLKGQKYMLELPGVGMKVYSDGETLWNYMEDGNQVTISNVEDNESDLMDPGAVFSIYERGFKSKFIQEVKEGSRTYFQIELYPDTGRHDVSKITLLIDKATRMISSALLHGTDGNLYNVKVTELQTDVELSDSYFVFEPDRYSDIEVIDFR